MLSTIAEICTILGFVVSLFTAGEIIKMSKSFNKNKGEVLYGDGEKNLVKDHSVIAKDYSSISVYDYSNANINGEIDELPKLEEREYHIYSTEIDQYKEGIEKTSFRMIDSSDNILLFDVNFINTISKPDVNRWIGYSIKSIPMKDWRSFVREGYCLELQYIATKSIDKIWIELTNFSVGKKIYRKELKLREENQIFRLQLGQFENRLEDWKSVDEICFVMFPEEVLGLEGTIFIKNIGIRKMKGAYDDFLD